LHMYYGCMFADVVLRRALCLEVGSDERLGRRALAGSCGKDMFHFRVFDGLVQRSGSWYCGVEHGSIGQMYAN